MAVRQEDVERVRQAIDIVALVNERVALKRVGRGWIGICPFHAENSPSLSVNGEKGYFHCFGCQKSGDAITFIRELDNLDFVEAIEQLASRSGLQLHYDDNAAVAAERKLKAQLTQAMATAVEWYHERLLSGSDAGMARAYLRDRGYDAELVKRFQIGWAPDAWDELSRALRLPPKVLSDTGLGFVNRRGRVQDAFRNRILFPIFDVSGKPVAFGGRVLPGSGEPKYKNSQETKLYSKSRTLYALNWAKADVVASEEVIICEGYTDVIGFFQAGLPRAVATCGTALTESHIRQLTNFAKRIVLAYDADRAGEEAAARVYEWERKLGVDIVVAAMPKGSDPADLARRDKDKLRDAVSEAQSFLSFRLNRALGDADLRSVEGRARAAERCLSIVAEQPNQLVRDQYLMQVADRCRVSVDQLRSALNEGSFEVPAPKPMRSIDVRAASRGKGDPPEVERAALRLSIHRPEDVASYFDDVFPGGLGAGVEDVLFEDARAQGAFRALVEAPTFLDAVDRAEPEAAELLGRLAMDDEDGNAREEFTRLIDRAAHRIIRDLQVQVRVRPGSFADIGPSLAWLKLTVEQLRRSETNIEASKALLGWLLEETKQSV